MIGPDIAAALTPVVEAFERLGVAYHLGGSLASSVHGLPRTTADVDVVAELAADQVSPLVAELIDAYYVDEVAALRAVERRASFNAIHQDTMLKVDVFVAAPTQFARQERALARPELLGERSFVVTSPENLVLRKLRWFRDGGETSERQWLDVQGVLKVQAGRLDQEYMREWAADLGVLDLLERAVAASSL